MTYVTYVCIYIYIYYIYIVSPSDMTCVHDSEYTCIRLRCRLVAYRSQVHACARETAQTWPCPSEMLLRRSE